MHYWRIPAVPFIDLDGPERPVIANGITNCSSREDTKKLPSSKLLRNGLLPHKTPEISGTGACCSMLDAENPAFGPYQVPLLVITSPGNEASFRHFGSVSQACFTHREWRLNARDAVGGFVAARP